MTEQFGAVIAKSNLFLFSCCLAKRTTCEDKEYEKPLMLL